MLLEPLGLAAGPVVPTREWRELYAALDCAAVAAIHPFYTASVREFTAAGRPIVASAPVGHDGTEAWLQAVGQACNVAQARIDAAKNKWLPAIRGALSRTPIKGRVTVSGYEGSELLVARLLLLVKLLVTKQTKLLSTSLVTEHYTITQKASQTKQLLALIAYNY
jgi:chlorophyllide a reductase subunit Y